MRTGPGKAVPFIHLWYLPLPQTPLHSVGGSGQSLLVQWLSVSAQRRRTAFFTTRGSSVTPRPHVARLSKATEQWLMRSGAKLDLGVQCRRLWVRHPRCLGFTFLTYKIGAFALAVPSPPHALPHTHVVKPSISCISSRTSPRLTSTTLPKNKIRSRHPVSFSLLYFLHGVCHRLTLGHLLICYMRFSLSFSPR